MKSMLYFVVGILILSGLTVVGMSDAGEKQETLRLSFLEPIVVERDGYVEIQLDGTTEFLAEPDRPVLPVYVKTYQIPFRSADIQVICSVNDVGAVKLTKQVVPARIIPLSQADELTGYVTDPVVYESTAFYPDNWFSYDIGAGRNEKGVQVTFVKVVCYPVRYSPMKNEIQYAGGFDIVVNFNEPGAPQAASAADDYDMVIIAPAKFQAALEPLVTHKNTKGVSTLFKSVEDILAEYDGFDPPEQIKYFIEHEYNHSNITYVTFVGGLKSHLYGLDKDTGSAGWKAWWVPVRYANLFYNGGGHGNDEAVLCDLYYGCLYNGTGAFDSWDSNGDGVYAAWGLSGVLRDDFDMNPEVYVSRIPCATVREVKAAVKKIKTYENTGPGDKPWYTNFVGIGGKTFNIYLGKPDGEYICDLTYNYTKNAIPDLTLTKCYASLRDVGRTPTPKDILKSLNEGAGFVNFQGHGNAFAWNTIWHDGTYPDDWTGGFNIFLYPLVINGNKLPVVVVGGCHNGLYNVSILTTLKDKLTNHTVHDMNYFCGMPSPYCFSAGLVLKAHGGAIASTGCTGYGLGAGGGDPVGSRSQALEANFFYKIGANVTHLSEAHGQAISKYLSEHVIVQAEAFCIAEWALFGDASLRFGGYSS